MFIFRFNIYWHTSSMFYYHLITLLNALRQLNDLITLYSSPVSGIINFNIFNVLQLTSAFKNVNLLYNYRS